MKSALRVLMVAANLRISNGVSSFLMNYFRSIDHNKIQMDFVIYNDIETPYYKEISDNGGKVYVLPPVKYINKHMKACKKIITEGNYDVVHDNILILSIGIMYYAKRLGVPVRILHSHNSKLSDSKIKALRNKIFMPILKNESTNYTACSKIAGQGMFGSFINYIVLPNIVSEEKLKFNPKIRNLVRNRTDSQLNFVIGTVGRLATQKNPFWAIDVIIKTKKIIPQLQYWWIGTGPLETEVTKYIHDKNAERYIHLLGNRTDVAELYQGMDLFFLPSLFEGLPVTGLEAQATGLTCLVSNTISDEFVYTKDLVDFFSIQQSPEQIALIIVNLQKKINEKKNRERYIQDLQQSVFSDKNAGNLLLKTYKQFLTENIKRSI